jgi:hypothetical protein
MGLLVALECLSMSIEVLLGSVFTGYVWTVFHDMFVAIAEFVKDVYRMRRQ